MTKPKEQTRSLIDAGFGPARAPEWSALGLPFDPHDFTIKDELPAKLAEVENVATLNLLQAFDTRNTAAALYERRIDELTQAAPAEE